MKRERRFNDPIRNSLFKLSQTGLGSRVKLTLGASVVRIALFLLVIFSALLGLSIQHPATAQNPSGTVSIYTYRTVTTRLTNENERLSSTAIAEKQNAQAADKRWRNAERLLQNERAKGSASKQRIEELEREASAREAEFVAVIDDLNDKLKAQDAEFGRMLRAAVDTALNFGSSAEGRRALELRALGGEDNIETGIALAADWRDIEVRAARLKAASAARSFANYLLGAKGEGPSATTAAIIIAFEEVVADDPYSHWDWLELSELYLDAGRTSSSMDAALKALETAESERGIFTALSAYGQAQVTMSDLTGAMETFLQAQEIVERLLAENPTSATLKYDQSLAYRNVSSVLSEQRGSSFVRGSHEIIEELVSAEPTSSALLRDLAGSLRSIGDSQLAEKKFANAEASYLEALQIMEDLVAQDPRSTDLQKELSTIHDSFGDLNFEKGDLSEALEKYKAGLAVNQELAEADPSSVAFRRDTLSSYRKIATAQQALGNLAGLLESKEKSFQIIASLWASEGSKILLQRDLRAMSDEIAVLQMRSGDFEAARTTYTQYIDELTKWMNANPELTELSTDIGQTNMKIGDTYLREGDRFAAAEHYSQIDAAALLAEQSGNFSSTLTRRASSQTFSVISSFQFLDGFDDPIEEIFTKGLQIREDRRWGDASLAALAISTSQWFDRVAERLVDESKHSKLPESFDNELSKLEAEAGAHPASDWLQFRLVIWHEKVGDFHARNGDLDAAHKSYLSGLAIIDRLAAAKPSSLWRQLELAGWYELVADLLVEQGNHSAAINNYRQSIAFLRRMAETSPNSVILRFQLLVRHDKLLSALSMQGRMEEASESYEAATAIFERLVRVRSQSPASAYAMHEWSNSFVDMEVDRGDLTLARQHFFKWLTILSRLAARSFSTEALKQELFAWYAATPLAGPKRDISAARESFANRLQFLEQQTRSHSDIFRMSFWLDRTTGELLGQGFALPEEFYTEELQRLERLVENDPTADALHFELIARYENRAKTYETDGDSSKALASYLKALSTIKMLARAKPSSDWRQFELAVWSDRVADAQAELGDYSGSHESSMQGLSALQRLVDTHSYSIPLQAELIRRYDKLVERLVGQSEHSAARQACDKLRAVQKNIDHPVGQNHACVTLQ